MSSTSNEMHAGTRIRAAATALTVALGCACGAAPQATGVGGDEGTVTFAEHVAPIVSHNCTSCHRPVEVAPFPLMSYRDGQKRPSSTVRTGPSWPRRPSSSGAEPMRKRPAGTTTISGPSPPDLSLSR